MVARCTCQRQGMHPAAPSNTMLAITRPMLAVVLAWCESSRDIAQLTRILSQLCAANRRENGGVVVVLCQHVRRGWQALYPVACCSGMLWPMRASACTMQAARLLVRLALSLD